MLSTLLALLVLAAPARAATQPFGGLVQFPGALGCISEDGSGGRCADGRALAGVSAVTAAGDRVYAVSPAGRLVVLEVNPRAGGFVEGGCFSATALAGCATLPALAGASDVAAADDRVYVTARGSDAVLRFRRSGSGLAYGGCVAAALAGCVAAPALNAPAAVAAGPRSGDVWVASSDSLEVFSWDLSSAGRCFREGGGGGCSPARALSQPRDVAIAGTQTLVASSGSNGVAVFRRGAQAGGTAGCITAGGSDGCAAGTGLLGAARIAAFRENAYVGAPGSGALTTLRVPSATAAPSRVASGSAPTGALAIPPETFVADAPSYAGSHVYAGGGGIAPFARDAVSGRLAAMAGPAFSPSGAVRDLAVSGDVDSAAVYAAVPSAGAVLAFDREIPPSCGPFFAPEPVPPLASGDKLVPLPCYDANGDELRFSLETPPARGRVAGFTSTAALYEPPATGPAGTDRFTVRVSDGAESALAGLQVRFPGHAVPRPKLRILDRRARMDRRGRIVVRLRCTPAAGRRCRATLAAGRARRGATLRAGRATKVRLALPRRLRRAVRRHAKRGVLVRLTATARDGAGRRARTTRKVRVRPRRSP